MRAIVDTCIWSEAFRKAKGSLPNPISQQLLDLADRDDAIMIGAVRQETLSGIPNESRATWLKGLLRAFPDLPVFTEDYERAADIFTQCRASGIQASNTDFLICAVALRTKASIFTTDKDFQHITKVIPIQLYPMN
jgi:predicted nucleic acid-binding protein